MIALDTPCKVAAIAWTDSATFRPSTVSLWSVEPRKKLAEAPAPPCICRLQVTGDGKRVVVSAEPFEGSSIKVYSAVDLKEERSHSFLTNSFVGIALSPDGKTLAVASTGGGLRWLQLWNLETLKAEKTLSEVGGALNKCAGQIKLEFTGGGALVAMCDEIDPDKPYRLKVWNVKTGQEHATLTGHTTDSQVQSMAVSSDGKLLVTSDLKKIVRVWEIPPVPGTGKVGAAPAEPSDETEARTWITADGKFQVEATFVKRQGNSIVLKRKDTGKEIIISLQRLSKQDRAFLSGK
jgi:WD40 repeat protein